MRGSISSILFDADQIQTRVAELGAEISRDYQGSEVFAVCLLKGSFVFTADLIRHITVPTRVDVMRASSYGSGTVSSGSVKVLYDLDADVADKDVLIVEDIVDTGRTLAKTLHLLRARNPRSLKIVSMLDKPSRREPDINIEIDYTGFQIEDHFVVGYGLDFDEYYRNLPYIGILNPNS